MKKVSLFLAVCFAAAPLFAGTAETKAPQLPPIDAGTILNQIENSQNHFPQPHPVTMDMCVFTKLIGNECLFKCESGVSISEPARQPGGVCATHILRPMPAWLPPSREVSRADQDWKHARIYAADGTVIAVDYSIMGLGGSITAAPVWFNVTNKAFGSRNKIRVVLMNYYDNQGMPSGQIQETQQIDLTYTGGTRYTGQAQKVVLSESHIGYGYNFRQEISVVVDGQWLSTTQGNSHNFPLKMTWY
ncbi:MAG TPA: hypothetical protein DCL44_11645 [Elusimicrobia bacterium]|nr:hypothetical protein [Elusimicrobiota bacterium]